MRAGLSTTGAALVAAAAIAGCGGSSGISDKDHKDFVKGCSSSQSTAGCECLFTQLTKTQGVNTQKKMNDLKNQIQAAAGNPAALPTKYRDAVIACRKLLHG